MTDTNALARRVPAAPGNALTSYTPNAGIVLTRYMTPSVGNAERDFGPSFRSPNRLDLTEGLGLPRSVGYSMPMDWREQFGPPKPPIEAGDVPSFGSLQPQPSPTQRLMEARPQDGGYGPPTDPSDMFSFGRPRDIGAIAKSSAWNWATGPVRYGSAGPINWGVQYDPTMPQSFGARIGGRFEW